MERVASEGLTFDDVLLLPAASAVLPQSADLSTQLTASIRLQIPLLSAAMDSVTEYRMAIALAKEGGLGFVHKNMSIKQQASEVKRVKKYEAGVVCDPECISPEMTLGELQALVQRNGFRTYPVVDEGRRLLGLVTGRDIKYQKCPEKKIGEFMTPLKRLITVTRQSSPTPKEAMDSRHYVAPTLPWTHAEIQEMMFERHIKKILVVDEDGHLAGLITEQDFKKAAAQPNATRDAEGSLRVGAAVGCGPDTLDRVAELVAAGVDVVLVDSSHGHSEGVLSTIRKIKAAYPSLQLIGGNVATAEGARAIAEAGADAVKVGVGPGSICTTRIVTGVGCPQFTAISEAVRGLRGMDVPVIADGGIRYSGDISKALAAGASCVMVGSMLAGTEESPGQIELFDGRSYKSYRGMGSLGAMANGSADRYFQKANAKFVPEGVEGRVPYKGFLRETLFQQMGGLRSCMGLTGCATIEQLRTKTRFVKITAAALAENHPHGVTLTKEPPNYSGRR